MRANQHIRQKEKSRKIGDSWMYYCKRCWCMGLWSPTYNETFGPVLREKCKP